MKLRQNLLSAAVALCAAFAVPSEAAAPSNQVAWYKVTNYASIQAAIDSCIANGGGVVYFPPGTYVLPNVGTTLHIWPDAGNPGPSTPRRGVTLRGDGADVCTIQAPGGVSDTLLQILRDNTAIEGLTFLASAGDSTSEADIILGDNTNSSHVLKYTRFEHVFITNAGRYCLKTTDSPYISIISDFESCRFVGNAALTGAAVRVGQGSTTFHFRNCEFGSFNRTGVWLDNAFGITFTDCVFEGELTNSGPFVYANKSVNCAITSGWFEDDPSAQGVGLAKDQWFVQLDKRCHGFLLSNSTFVRGGISGKNPRQPKVLQVLGTAPGDESIGVVALNPDMSVPGVVDSTTFKYVDIASDLSEVYLLGGGLRDSLAYRRVMISDTDRLMTLGGTRGMKLMRLPDATILTLPTTEKGRSVYNKGTNRIDIVNDAGLAGVATGIR